MDAAPADEAGRARAESRTRGQKTLRPRAGVRRYLLIHFGLGLALVLGAGVGYALLERQSRARQWRDAQARLRSAVPLFETFRLKPVRSASSHIRGAEVLDNEDTPRATAVLRDHDRLYVSFLAPGPPYRPASDYETARWLDEAPSADPKTLRMTKHGLGAVAVLWPDPEADSVHLDKIEAVSHTARQATLLLSLDTEAGRIGTAVEIDLYARRLLAVELRFGV